MPSAEKKSFAAPEETRPFPNGKMDIVSIGGGSVGKATFEPGWKWSLSVKPIAKTDSCQGNHQVYVFSGRMHIAMTDGTEIEIGPGDVAHIPPGHDAWVLGSEPCVALDFGAAKTYAAK